MREEDIKAAVRERDGFRCIRCGLDNEEHRRRHYGKSLHVHRLTPGSPYSIDGCETVCYACHGVSHRKQAVVIPVALSHECLAFLDLLATQFGIGRAAVVSHAIRQLASQEGMK